MECKYRNNRCRLAGRRKNGAQRLYCESCKKYRQQKYIYYACSKGINENISKLLCEGVGIRSAARILCISASTVMKKIKAIAAYELAVGELSTRTKHNSNSGKRYRTTKGTGGAPAWGALFYFWQVWLVVRYA